MEKTITISYNEYLELVAKKQAYDNESVILREESFDGKYTTVHKNEELKAEIEKRKAIERSYSDYKQENSDNFKKLRQHYDNTISEMDHQFRHASDRGDRWEREFGFLMSKFRHEKGKLDEVAKKSLRGFWKWKKQYFKK